MYLRVVYKCHIYSMADNFSENLIKGRIAETVFERMFREETKFDMYPLGYEYTMPILQQVKNELLHQEKKDTIQSILDNVDDLPDYLLVKSDKSELYMVEVRYLEAFDLKKILNAAEKINSRWHPAWLFEATKDGFYFDACQSIITHKKMKPLDWVDINAQQKYLKLIQDFEK